MRPTGDAHQGGRAPHEAGGDRGRPEPPVVAQQPAQRPRRPRGCASAIASGTGGLPSARPIAASTGTWASSTHCRRRCRRCQSASLRVLPRGRMPISDFHIVSHHSLRGATAQAGRAILVRVTGGPRRREHDSSSGSGGFRVPASVMAEVAGARGDRHLYSPHPRNDPPLQEWPGVHQRVIDRVLCVISIAPRRGPASAGPGRHAPGAGPDRERPPHPRGPVVPRRRLGRRRVRSGPPRRAAPPSARPARRPSAYRAPPGTARGAPPGSARASVTASSSVVATGVPGHGVPGHRGMFPCLRIGAASRLVASVRSARPT